MNWRDEYELDEAGRPRKRKRHACDGETEYFRMTMMDAARQRRECRTTAALSATRTARCGSPTRSAVLLASDPVSASRLTAVTRARRCTSDARKILRWLGESANASGGLPHNPSLGGSTEEALLPCRGRPMVTTT